MKLAKDIGALKAVSQNLMHSNLTVTDGIYGILSSLDVQKEIGSLGQRRAQDDDGPEALVNLMKRLLQRLEGEHAPEGGLVER